MKRNIVVAITGASGAIYAVRLLDVLIAAGCDVQLSISPAGAAVLRQELNIEVSLDDFQLADLLPTREEVASLDRFAALRTLIGADAWCGAAQASAKNPPPLQGGDGGRVAASAPTHLSPSPLLSKREHASATDTPAGRVRYHHFQNLFAEIASGSALTDGMVVCPCSGGTLSAIACGASGNLIQRAADVHLKERRKLILVPRETPLSLVHIENMRRVTEAGAIVLPAMPGFYQGVTTLRDVVDFVVARICDQLGVPQTLTRRWGDEKK